MIGKLKLVKLWNYYLQTEEGVKVNFTNGLKIKYDGQEGRIYNLQDKSSHNGGHGMGQMYSSQVLFAFGDNQIGILQCDGKFVIEIIEE